MKKALFALGLLAFAILPGCGGDCKDCGRKEVQMKSYGKGVHTQVMDAPAVDDVEFEFGEEDDYDL